MALYQVVSLTEEERASMLALISKGKAPARQIRRANTLLQLHDGIPESIVARNFNVSTSTVRRTRRRFVEDGLQVALSERPRPGAKRKLDGKGEALLVAVACSTPPESNTVWTMQLLADRMVSLGVVETISDETIRRALKKMKSSRGRGRSGVSLSSTPPLSGAWRMYWTFTVSRMIPNDL